MIEREENRQFQLVSNYQPNGDQPEAIKQLVTGLKNNKKEQILLGATRTERLLLFQMLFKK